MVLIASSLIGATLKDVSYSVKQNGIMVNLDYTDAINDDDIIGWKSDRGWLYLTLLGVKAPENMIPNTGFNGVVKDIVLDDFDESIQIAILVGRPIAGYDIVNSQNEPTTVIFIHTQMRRSEVYSLKKHIEKEPKTERVLANLSVFDELLVGVPNNLAITMSLIHISEPTRRYAIS